MSAPTSAVLTSHDLRNRLNSSDRPVVVDVRTPAEFVTAHIRGAVNIPLDLVRERAAEIAGRVDGGAVFVCRTGQRASQADALLRDAGLSGGAVLEGGIVSWEENGFDVERGTQRWDLERQVRLVAGSVVLSSVLGSVAVPKLKWLAAAIGGGLTFAAVSNTCAMAAVLSKLPYNRTANYDASQLVSQLSPNPAPAS